MVVDEVGYIPFDPHAAKAPDVEGVDRNRLVANTDIDPLSQTPAFNSTYVQVSAANDVVTARPRGRMVEKRKEGERNVRCWHDRDPGAPASRSI